MAEWRFIMILQDYEVKKTEICDCSMASIVNAAIYYKRDYAYLFKGIWVFDFKEKGKDNTFFWQRLMTPEQIDSLESLYYHHGILMTLIEDGFEKFLHDVDYELREGNPIFLEFNAFYCPWAGVYMKVDLKHFCLIVGYDRAKSEVICSDPYISRKLHRFTLDELEKGFIQYYKFEKKEPLCNGVEQWKKDVRIGTSEKFVKNNGKNTFEKMRLFADEIHDPNNFIDEMKRQNDTYSYELFYQMKYISHSRLNYAEFLRFIAKEIKGNELVLCAENLEEAARIWRLIWLKFTKVAYLENKDKIQLIMNNIFVKTKKAMELEYIAAEKLMQLTE